MSETLLLTGGAGYIGSHMALVLLQAGYRVIVLDNLSNGSLESLRRVERISGASAVFIEGDILDTKLLKRIFHEHPIKAVLHFAGLKAVGESVENPLLYYHNNVVGTLALLQAMQQAQVKRFVFSSSATVYGEPLSVPIDESMSLGKPASPYGQSKLMIEQILRDLSAGDPDWRIALLRYFNPAGAHESGQIGEDPCGIPNNLMPFISQVAIGKWPHLDIYGNDYPTPDGTGIRDYIHVMDLVEGHLSAMKYIDKLPGVHTWNLGTGQGYSVLHMVSTFEKVSGQSIPYNITAPRPGDVASCYADASKAKAELGWVARRSLEEMVSDTWRWQQQNPNGYEALSLQKQDSVLIVL